MRIERPGHAAALHAAIQNLDVCPIQSERTRDLGHADQVHDFRRGQPRLRQREQILERGEDAMRSGHRHIGQMVGQWPFVLAGLTKHRAQQGHIVLDIRCHDDNIGRRQFRVFMTLAQQCVTQHFEFAQACVTDVDAQ